MNPNRDRLYNLLPAVYRERDHSLGEPLRALLQVIAEQVDVVEADIDQLYRNWFIETCDDWAVPYIADLIGYQPVEAAGTPGDSATPDGQARNRVLIPRREVANTIRYRRRKGTLALLELLAHDVAGWNARAVEFYKLVSGNAALNHLRPDRRRTVDLRQGDALSLINSPFDSLAHTVDVRRIASPDDPGRYNLPNIGLFVWRLKTYSVTQTAACCHEEVGPHCYTFSVLGNDTPLYTHAVPDADPTDIADPLNLPIPIRRRAFETRTLAADGTVQTQASTDYYGDGRSLTIWAPGWHDSTSTIPISPERIIPADLSDWHYRPRPGRVAVDPELGRIAFPPGQLPRSGVMVSYYYGFSADIGGGEYNRPLIPLIPSASAVSPDGQPNGPAPVAVYRVQQAAHASDTALRDRSTASTDPPVFETLSAAIAQWQSDRPMQAMIEIADNGVYVEPINLELAAEQTLSICAANRTRPVLRLLNWYTAMPDGINVSLESGSRFSLDGLLITGRGVRIRQADRCETDLPAIASPSSSPLPELKPRTSITIRHCTLVPGWSLDPNCDPHRPAEPSLELDNLHGSVMIEHSILGSIQVNQDEVKTDPVAIEIRDSVVDATDAKREAVGAPGYPIAHATLTVLRSTIIGQVQTHAIALAENSIFTGLITVARSQIGCMRFCAYVKGSRTPKRFRCQPDLAIAAVEQESLERGVILSPDELAEAQQRECDRVQPRFNSTRYGTPTYCQLAHRCPPEIVRGADDESEMGVFHHLYQPQRAANLQTRLNDYTPAGLTAAVLYAS